MTGRLPCPKLGTALWSHECCRVPGKVKLKEMPTETTFWLGFLPAWSGFLIHVFFLVVVVVPSKKWLKQWIPSQVRLLVKPAWTVGTRSGPRKQTVCCFPVTADFHLQWARCSRSWRGCMHWNSICSIWGLGEMVTKQTSESGGSCSALLIC